jgi:uncharacterized membrane protein YdjX (TVP38/TMEM64 family)
MEKVTEDRAGNQASMKEPNSRRRAAIKASALLGIIMGGILLTRFTPLKDYLTTEALGSFLNASGFMAPLLFIIIYTVSICLFVPAILLTVTGAAIFGPYLGFIYVWVGAMAGGGAAFLIGRNLGRDFAASVIGNRLEKYDAAIERNGFATVLYLRLIYFPFTALSFGMGLTRVRFRDYLLGTGLGIIVGTFLFTFFIGTLKEIWVSGDWSRLLSAKVFLSAGLFVLSFFIPVLIKRWREA